MHLTWLDPAGVWFDGRKKTVARNDGEGGGKEPAPGARGSIKKKSQEWGRHGTRIRDVTMGSGEDWQWGVKTGRGDR
jgi:hypothetical protein